MQNQMGPVYLSKSKSRLYEQCPHAYKLKYLLNLPEEDKPSYAFGRKQHEFYYNFFDLIYLDERDAFQTQFMSNHMNNPCSRNFIEFQRKRWESCLRNRKEKAKEYFFPVHREEKIISKKKACTGIPDAIYRNEYDDELDVIEYKTGRPNIELADKYVEDLLWYKLLFEAETENRIDKGYIYFSSSDTYVKKILLQEAVDRLGKKINSIRDSILRLEFEPTKDKSKCDDCSFRLVCEYNVAENIHV